MRSSALGEKKFLDVVKELRKTDYPTRFNFLMAHKGMRKAELSTVLSPNGSGKSTLVRSIIVEMLMAEKKVYTYLSEEVSEKYVLDLYQYFLVLLKSDFAAADAVMRNLFTESAFEGKKFSRIDPLIESIRQGIQTEMIDAIFIDNFTASFMGSAPIAQQGDAIMKLKGLAIEFDIPVVLVVHTVKNFDVYSSVMTSDNVRGNATTANVGSYNYCMSTFWRGERPRSFVSVDKARYHGEAQKRFYELGFDKDLKIFTSDKEVTFKEFQEAQGASGSKVQIRRGGK